MVVDRVEVDSVVFGRNVLTLSDIAPTDDISEAEVRYVEAYDPSYVSCRVALEDVGLVHQLERGGFALVECQIRLVARFGETFDVSRWPYRYELVATREALSDVLDIASRTVVHDRFSIDPALAQGISGARYRRYVERSYAVPDEQVWRLFDPATRMTLSFRSHRATGPHEVLLLLGGVHPDLKNLGLGVVASHFCFNQMCRDGVRRAVTHISSINYPIMNLELGALGFRAVATFAVLRKVYA